MPCSKLFPYLIRNYFSCSLDVNLKMFNSHQNREKMFTQRAGKHVHSSINETEKQKKKTIMCINL